MTTNDITSPACLWIRRWLIVITLMVYSMILIGGITRLTDSGLAITEWAPVRGILPPLDEPAWQAEFAKYQTTTEYKQVNSTMTLDQFRFLYGWEWGHRLFGRLIGLVALGGMIWFAAKRWLNRSWMLRLLALLALGGLQGFIGWWMVASGIGETERVDVAPYRLMVHFGLALVIIALAVWFWLDLGGRKTAGCGPVARTIALVLLVLTGMQMLGGALVAGLDAGRTYTDWPLMAGELIPDPWLYPELGWRSLFEGRAATQFNHRTLAYVLWISAVVASIALRKNPLAPGFRVFAILLTLQVFLGILTLVHAAPLALALIHQGLGVIILLAAVRLVWASMPARIHRHGIQTRT